RFTALALPRVLYRRPYGDAPGHTHRFDFREDTTSPDRRGYLWGSPVFALAAVAVRAFAESGWLADIRGARPENTTGGRAIRLPRLGYGTGVAGAPRPLLARHPADGR